MNGQEDEMESTTRRRLGAIALAVMVLAAPALPAAAQAPRPVTLVEALTLAAQKNHGLRVAAVEVKIARAQLAQAEAAKSGQITLSASYTRTNERDGGTMVIPPGTIPGITVPITITLPGPDPNIYSAALTYQIPLHTGGRLESQIALAQANLRGAEAALERAKQQLVLDVKQAYYQVLLAQAGVEVAARAASAADENLRVARARVAAGVSPRFDEVQAEVNLANARQGQIRSHNSLALAQHGLNALMVLPLDTVLQPRETMTVVPVRSDTAALVRRALEARPEMVEHRARIDVALAAVEIARAGGRPMVVLSGGPSYGNPGGSLVKTSGWAVTLSATLSLFDGGLTAQRVREAESRVEQLREAEAQIRQGIELEVRRALLNLSSAAEELAAADKAVELAKEGLRIANVRFAAGVSTNLEVVTAQASLSQAEGNRIQALFNVNLARAQLERAAGGPVE